MIVVWFILRFVFQLLHMVYVGAKMLMNAIVGNLVIRVALRHT